MAVAAKTPLYSRPPMTFRACWMSVRSTGAVESCVLRRGHALARADEIEA